MLSKAYLVFFNLMIFLTKGCIGEFESEGICLRNDLIEKHKFNRQIYRDCKEDLNEIFIRQPRRVDPLFRGNPKPRADILAEKFKLNINNYDQTYSLVKLINKIAFEYLAKCPPVIYYDRYVKKSDGLFLENLFKTLPITFYHGEINEKYEAINSHLKDRIDIQCQSYILFLSDPSMTLKIIGSQVENRVVLVARSSQWKLRDFLSSEKSSNIVNLLVIGESYTADLEEERPYVLYTHKLYTDGLGSNKPIVLTSWIKGELSRPHINLFPKKFENGFAGHRFTVSSVNQPPFVFSIKKIVAGGSISINWDGIEYRLLNTIAQKLNFSIDITEPPIRSNTRGIIEAIQYQVSNNLADIGMSGIYITEGRLHNTDMSIGHSRDCAAFITLASKALPKYRAIMGPFQWPVWLALTLVYLGAIFPIVYTDRLSLSHLMGNWGEMENMFWYVFGMFTNSLTFSGKYSWSSSKKLSTRILIGFYWFFTIIITACYTGSIIAFVTLPAFPETIDSVLDLLGLFFRVGTLDNGGWEIWFQNSTHTPTARLYKKMEFVSSFEEGIGNVTQSFFWNYAFLGSKAQLEYLVQANFSDENISRRSLLHLSEECFALFQTGYIFPRNAVYKNKIDSMILLAQQSGLMNKIERDVRWTMQKSSTGKLLQASSATSLRERIQEERQLTTEDTEGMFLLMGIGYTLGAIALISEIVGGITNKCRQIVRRSRKSISSTWSSARSSAIGTRTEAEKYVHQHRKEIRRREAENSQMLRQESGRFGVKQFNLTKATLKEIYGNYNKPEPNYSIKDGKLILESDVISTATNSASRESSTELLIPPLCIKKKTIVLAEIDNPIEPEFHDDNSPIDGDIQNVLDGLDRCITGYDLSRQASHDDIVFGEFTESDLFGSYIDPSVEESNERKFENLAIFEVINEENEMKSNIENQTKQSN